MRLPSELIIHIINQLATPVHELAYTYPPLVLTTLLNLALVSHAVSTWTYPFIYARIVVTSPAHLRILHRSLCHKPAGQRTSVEAFAIIRSYDDHDYDLNPETARQIRDLLDAMSPTLQRLTIDLPLRHLDPEDPWEETKIRTPIREALLRLPHIFELVSIRDGLVIGDWGPAHSVWPTWTSLRRLALYNPGVSLEFENELKGLPHIEHLVLVRYDDDMLVDLIRRSPTIKVIALVNPWSSSLDAVAPVFKERRDIRFDLCVLEYGDNTDAVQNWYRAQTLHGTLWKGQDWWDPISPDS